MNLLDPKIERAIEWLQRDNGEKFLSSDDHCHTRDIFEGRLIKMSSTMARMPKLENISAIVFAITGELGNNAFDHNLGKWRDEPGIYYFYDFEKRFIVIADRGQGVLSSLRRVKPELKNDQDALQTAFTEIISGRAPEARGKGLKFVKQNCIANNFELYFSSGNAIYTIPDPWLHEEKKQIMLYGVFAVLSF